MALNGEINGFGLVLAQVVIIVHGSLKLNISKIFALNKKAQKKPTKK